ncbi:hypothetical protein FHR99_000858 [Litorivivens lipolytica]|uniref:Haemolysin activator HlyB C-terminal domain-containing protein n=1 Tax=Litorivivens lipolytica TaxID=1524264 RepID=A0A7W4Z503_9GAMM|nr:ShlB/FhaC/HecB family hemolysin secretion/activation protein [Litorivivens lipolytica]MBB3046622.1 hypothetical protein [Litorivivens lipolytica]
MPIDLPPSLPPSLENPSSVIDEQRSRGAYIRTVGDFSVQVSGDHYLSFDELEAIFDKARTPSEAILLMNDQTRQKGHWLVEYLYARPVNGIVHVLAIQKRLGEIEGDDAITHFFSGLENTPSLKRHEFLRRQILANQYSRRTGRDYSTTYSSANAGALNIQLNEKASSKRKRWRGSLQLGNQGNRFVGRYFADTALSYTFSRGTQLQARHQRAIPEWGETGEGEDYNSNRLSISHPSRWGIYELEASHSEYTRNITTPATAGSCSAALFGGVCLSSTPGQAASSESFDATIQTVAINAQQLISADTDHRWTLQQRLEYIDSELSNRSLTPQDESYTALEIGTRYEALTPVAGKALNWRISLHIDHGLSSDSGTFATAPESPSVAIGKRTAEFTTAKPSFSVIYPITEHWEAELSAQAQLTNDQLPQQQQWVLGGTSRLHAYLPGVLVGDSGYHAKASLKRKWSINDDVTLSASVFYEAGAAGYEDVQLGNSEDVDLSQYSTLQDAGLSASIRAGDHLELTAVAAAPTADSNISVDHIEAQEADFFIVLKASF